MADDNDAPGRLKLIQDFVNSVDLESGKDELSDPAACEAWFRLKGFSVEQGSLTDAGVTEVVRTREAFRDLMDPEAAEEHARAARILSEVGESCGFSLRFDSSSAHLEVRTEGVEGALGQLLSIAYVAMKEGTWDRLKACAKDSCRWAFYDHARNRSGRWCSMAVCGNRVKAQNYRRKTASETS